MGNLAAQDQPELKIHGAEKPGLWQLVAVGFIILPYTTGKVRVHGCTLTRKISGLSDEYPVRKRH